MSVGLNKVCLIGNVGKDPEIRTTSENKELIVFSLATTEIWRNRDGEKKENTEWHRIVVFNLNLIDIIKKFVKKGTKLYLEGALKNRKWVDNNGQERYSYEIVMQGNASTLVLLSKKSDSEPSNMQVGSNPGSDENNNNNNNNSLGDDEVPF